MRGAKAPLLIKEPAMKKTLLVVIVLSLSAAALCLEPVGMTVPFSMKAGLRAESASSLNVVAFPDSSFVKVHLDSLELEEGDSLVLSDGERTIKTLDGPFSGDIWLPSVTTGAAYLTLESPERSGSAGYSVDKVGVGFFSGHEPESVCGIDDRRDAVCYSSELQTVGLAVGRMLFSDGAGWYLCTGSLISPYGHFLTNNHCIEEQYGASTLEVWWNYKTSTCGGGSGSYDYVTTGSTFITTDQVLDFTLLQIGDSQLNDRYGYLKIAARTPVKGESIWIPQHGGGTVKRFAVDSDMDGGHAKVVDESLAGNASDTDIGYWADTEGGSSGSPVLDSNNKILALHHFGVYYSCGDYDMNQGVKMSLIYPEIAEYLGDIIPPSVSSVSKATNPFRLIINGSNFKSGILAYIGGDSSPWPTYAYKSTTKFVLKGNNSLKNRFPKGTAVEIKLVNTDGGTVYTTYTR